MAPISRTDHVALVTGDTAATVDFYTRVLEWPLVDAHRGEKPDGRRSFISVFQADGFVLEFEEVDGRPGVDQQVAGFPHIGLDVRSADEYDRWKAHLESCAVEYLEVRQHNCWFADPNGLNFQLIVKGAPDGSAEQRPDEASRMVQDWLSRDE